MKNPDKEDKKPSRACEYPGCTNTATMTFGTDFTPVCDDHSGWHKRDYTRAPAVEPEQRPWRPGDDEPPCDCTYGCGKCDNKLRGEQ